MPDSTHSLTTIDQVILAALSDFRGTSLQRAWYGKEHDWVSLFAFSHLVKACRAGSPLYDCGQISIDVGVPQPTGFSKPATRRDIVIWAEPGGSCWSLKGEACQHPLAILEWKVHRPGYRNRLVAKEREWLRKYTVWQPEVVAYAVELELDGGRVTMNATRFHSGTEEAIRI